MQPDAWKPTNEAWLTASRKDKKSLNSCSRQQMIGRWRWRTHSFMGINTLNHTQWNLPYSDVMSFLIASVILWETKHTCDVTQGEIKASNISEIFAVGNLKTRCRGFGTNFNANYRVLLSQLRRLNIINATESRRSWFVVMDKLWPLPIVEQRRQKW